MYKLLYTSNISFSMRDWKCKPIKEVFAGKDCIMAITETGETLQKVRNAECMGRMQCWTRIKQIGISKWAEGVAIGLVEDGTCIISKRPVRQICENQRLNFEHIYSIVNSWTDIIQVEASDAFFALSSNGTVQYISLCARFQPEYEAVKGWKDVTKIVTGTQNSVFGVTKNGKILAAGSNVSNIVDSLFLCEDIVDVYPTGSECTKLYALKSDGSVLCFRPNRTKSSICGDFVILDGHFNNKVFGLSRDREVVDVSSEKKLSIFSEKYKVTSFAVGDYNYSEPFVIAVAEVGKSFKFKWPIFSKCL